MARTSPLSRRRRLAIWSLIGLASLLAIVAILATWVNRQILDNGSFETTSTRLVQDPAIQSALSTYLVNSAYENVDIPAALAERLPPNLKPLAAPLAAAVRASKTSSSRPPRARTSSWSRSSRTRRARPHRQRTAT
jgi:hypothetical protein